MRPALAANAANVGASNSARTGSSTRRAVRTREVTWVARSE